MLPVIEPYYTGQSQCQMNMEWFARARLPANDPLMAKEFNESNGALHHGMFP